MSDEYKLLLSFDNDDPRFVDGFEMGRLWALAQDGGEVAATIHAHNAEMAMRIAETTCRPFEASDLSDGWVELRLGLPSTERSGDE